MKFVVVKQGVYMRDAHGPFDEPVEAKAFAQTQARNDVDAYHDWEVRAITRDGLSQPIASYRKDIGQTHQAFDYRDAITEDRARQKAPRPTGAPDAEIPRAPCGCLRVVRKAGEDPVTLHVVDCVVGARERQGIVVEPQP